MKEIIFILLLIFEALIFLHTILSIKKPDARIWPSSTNNVSRNYWFMAFFYTFLLGVVYLSYLERDEVLFGNAYIQKIGACSIFIGLALYAWCRLHFSKKLEFGFAEKLVSSGPFKFVRNPIYIADFLIFVGFALWWDSQYIAIVLVILTLILLYLPIIEEPWLCEKYGKEYEVYCLNVPRYIPKIFLK